MAGIPEEINGARVLVRRSRRRRRTISLALHPSGAVILSAPVQAPEKFLEDFFSSRLSWIKKRLKDFRQGESFVQKPASPAFIAHCRSLAQSCLEEKIAHFGQLLDVRPRKIKVNSATTRWGSCSAQDNLNFPWRIVLLPPAVIDYIVVHELAHIKEKNHGPGFWRTVAGMMPDFKTHRTWLRKNSRLFRC